MFVTKVITYERVSVTNVLLTKRAEGEWLSQTLPLDMIYMPLDVYE